MLYDIYMLLLLLFISNILALVLLRLLVFDLLGCAFFYVYGKSTSRLFKMFLCRLRTLCCMMLLRLCTCGDRTSSTCPNSLLISSNPSHPQPQPASPYPETPQQQPEHSQQQNYTHPKTMILFWQRNSKEFVEFYLLMITACNVDHPFSYGMHCLNDLGNLRIS